MEKVMSWCIVGDSLLRGFGSLYFIALITKSLIFSVQSTTDLLFDLPNGYAFVQERLDWDTANQYCNDTFGTQLATITNDVQASAVMAHAVSVGVHVLIGLHDRDAEGEWEWVSGHQCSPDCASLSYWQDGEPNDASTGEDCSYVRNDANSFDNMINDMPCSHNYYFACDVDPDNAVPQISVSRWVTCATWHGVLKCWGYTRYADPEWTTIDGDQCISSPTSQSLNLGDNFTVRKVISGRVHNCAISTLGYARCWGSSGNGRLGYGNTELFSNSTNFGQNIDLGTNFVIDGGSLGDEHSCFISTNHSIKCFGLNDHGELGLGDTVTRGDVTGQMGDNLPTVDLGSNFVPIQLVSGSDHNCVLSEAFSVKCWGQNSYGQLGLGDTAARGTSANQMGDYLPEIDLGSFVPIRIESGGYHVCVISAEKEMLCWGYNMRGQLGLEHSNTIGDEPGEMGSNLSTVNLGTGFLIHDLYLGASHSCASSTSGELKCWGRGDLGSLGSENTTDVGDSANSMGDFLKAVDLGTGFNVSYLSKSGTDAYHSCAVSTEMELKCWGWERHCQLGIGGTFKSSNNIGDAPGEMGDFLPFVNLIGPTMEPTMDPTKSPSNIPTIDPTKTPTTIPTIDPTADPTQTPSYSPSVPTIEPSQNPSSHSATFGNLNLTITSLESFSDGIIEIGWLEYSSCTEGKLDNGLTYNPEFKQSELINLAQHAVTIKILPSSDIPGGDETADYSIMADLCSNPIFALNNGYEMSFTLDEHSSPPIITNYSDTDNWIGTATAKDRMRNDCFGNQEFGTELTRSLWDGHVYHPCGNPGGLHVSLNFCYFDWQDITGHNMTVWLGFDVNQKQDCGAVNGEYTLMTLYPTTDPTSHPNDDPSVNPTVEPTIHPSTEPTAPTLIPSTSPSVEPTFVPSDNPTIPHLAIIPTADSAETSNITSQLQPTSVPTDPSKTDNSIYPETTEILIFALCIAVVFVCGVSVGIACYKYNNSGSRNRSRSSIHKHHHMMSNSVVATPGKAELPVVHEMQMLNGKGHRDDDGNDDGGVVHINCNINRDGDESLTGASNMYKTPSNSGVSERGHIEGAGMINNQTTNGLAMYEISDEEEEENGDHELNGNLNQSGHYVDESVSAMFDNDGRETQRDPNTMTGTSSDVITRTDTPASRESE